MKHGHVTGHKHERTGVTPHFDALQAAHLARIEQAQAAQQAQLAQAKASPQPAQAA